MDTRTYIEMQNDDEAPYEDEIAAATAAHQAEEEKRKTAIEAERAAGRPSPAERRSAKTVRFPLDDTKAAFAAFARSMPQASASEPPPDLARHSRRCTVCAHPDRDAIEAEFIRWLSPSRIAEDYGIADRHSIYRHAHATGLLYRRRSEAARILENVLERAECTPTDEFDVITRALRLYTHLDDDARWREPVRTVRVFHGRIDSSAPDLAPVDAGSTSE